MITIINYGMGNLGSVQNMLKRIGIKSIISSDINEIEKAEKILLPGVGSFDAAISKIDELNLRPVLTFMAKEKKVPFLGICLGMQLLTESSEEGVLKFPENSNLKIPHMGWNLVTKKTESVLTKNFTDEFRFYFVHSYHVKCDNPINSILTTNYGYEFDSAIQNENVFGAQFHPEKSHKYGMQLLSNFANI